MCSSKKTELSQLPSEAEREGLSCSGHGKRIGENHYTRQLTDEGIHCHRLCEGKQRFSSKKQNGRHQGHQSAIIVVLLIVSLILSCKSWCLLKVSHPQDILIYCVITGIISTKPTLLQAHRGGKHSMKMRIAQC